VSEDAPDPGVGYFKDRFYMVNTGKTEDGGAFTIRTSKDLANWERVGSIFSSTSLPRWSKPGSEVFWAPEIHAITSNSSEISYACYYVANHTKLGKSVGVAVSKDPAGPYSDIGSPLCSSPRPPSTSMKVDPGAIDPTFFRDADGQQYLLWKDEGPPTQIRIQALAPNGTAFATNSTPTDLLTNDQLWEAWQVEAPWLIKHNSEYFLFYSGGKGTWDPTYAVGVARSTNVRGPYTKSCGPILTQDSSRALTSAFRGPGHCSVVTTPAGKTVMLYHQSNQHNSRTAPRVTFVDEVVWDEQGWPSMVGTCGTPSQSSQVLPTAYNGQSSAQCVESDADYVMQVVDGTMEWGRLPDSGNGKSGDISGAALGLVARGQGVKLRTRRGIPFYPCGGVFNFEAIDSPGSFVCANNSSGMVSLAKVGATVNISQAKECGFVVRSGMACGRVGSTVSLRSVVDPSRFIAVGVGTSRPLELTVPDGSSEFAQNATFTQVTIGI
jgi:beta-xylosidase